MDPFSEFVVLAFLIVAPPVFLLRLFYRAIVREVSSWAPEPRKDRHRYRLVQVIPQRPTAAASSAWWPRDRWSPPHGR